jgi:hypothetical protein
MVHTWVGTVRVCVEDMRPTRCVQSQKSYGKTQVTWKGSFPWSNYARQNENICMELPAHCSSTT